MRVILIVWAVASLITASGYAASDMRLVHAVKAGDKAAVASLLQQRVDANIQEPDGTSALHWAVLEGELDMAEQLIRAGADVSAANRYGVTPLYLAAVNGSAGMIAMLLKSGADANAAVTEGETALMTVARTGNVDAARVLLAHGAEVDARESWRAQTSLMWAAAQKHPGMVRELIANGADVNARSAVHEWERQNTAEPRQKWLPLGGLTPLMFAARHGCVGCVPILLDAGADVNVTDPDGISALILAIINGHYDVAAVLLRERADPNLADKTGRTALYAAVDFNTMPSSNRPAPKVIGNELTSLDLIKLLLENGANVDARLRTQQPYRTKLDRGNDTMLTTGTTPFLRAAKAADVAAMWLLLENGADVSLATRAGINPLMAAAGLGTKEEDTTGRFKTEDDAIEAIKLCLAAGMDVNATDSRGQTALHGAALQGFDKVVRFLVEKGAALDVKDSRGFTPLDVAMGNAGGFGFDGRSGVYRETTAAVIRQLMAGNE